MYDIHCHILYGVDDGSTSFDESCRMIALAAENGTDGIVATPHCNIPNDVENYWSRAIYDKLCELRNFVSENNINIGLYCGQEIFCTDKTPELLQQGKLITLNNTRYPLIEFDFLENSDFVFETAEKLISLGYVPVIAHPERYAFISEEYDAAARLKSLGCAFQVNKDSFTGSLGRNAQKAAHVLLDDEYIDLIASDAHGSYGRDTNLSEAFDYISDAHSIDYAEALLETNPTLLLQNKELITI